MRKRFASVKQLLKTEKSEHLSLDLQEAEQKIEYMRACLDSLSKRFATTVAVKAGIDNVDNKAQTSAEYQLGLAMIKYSSQKDELEEGLLKLVVRKCGEVKIELARQFAEHETKIEQIVSSPLKSVVENEIPNIIKQKKVLSKLVLEKDIVSTKCQAASKYGTINESLQTEMNEAVLKVEQCRVTLAAEMFSFLKREPEFAQYILQLVKLQQAYHDNALHTLKFLIPEIEKEINDSSMKVIFGCPLDEHLRLHKRQIALPLELCVCALWELGMMEEGLLRIAGGSAAVHRMKLSIDSNCFCYPLQYEYRDVHVIASVLKSYLRELPEPLLTFNLYKDWINTVSITSEDQRSEAIQALLSLLPKTNYDNLRYLIKFLAELSTNSINKMTSSNIAIVMAPNLLWSSDEANEMDMSNIIITNSIVELLVRKVDRFFPGKFDAYQTFEREELFPDLIESDKDKALIQQENNLDKPHINTLMDRYSPPPESRKIVIRRAPNPPLAVQCKSEVEKIANPLVPIKLENNLDRYNPPQGSSKPIIRRAPSPPLTVQNNHEVETLPKPSFLSGSSTINRRTYRAAKKMQEFETNNPQQKTHVKVETENSIEHSTKRNGSDQNNIVLRKSFSASTSPSSVKKSRTRITKNDISFPIFTKSTMNLTTLKSTGVFYTTQTTNSHQTISQNATVEKTNVPVAAPRKIIPYSKAMSRSLNELDMDNLNDKSNKPDYPERPATLSPSKFKLNTNRESHVLEQAYMYNAPEKQQISILQVPQCEKSRHPDYDTQMAKEKFLERTQKEPSEFSFVRTQSVGSKHELEHMKSLEGINVNNGGLIQHPGLLRTMSDGNILDTVIDKLGSRIPTALPRYQRGLTKPPKPQPPPRLTPITTKFNKTTELKQ